VWQQLFTFSEFDPDPTLKIKIPKIPNTWGICFFCGFSQRTGTFHGAFLITNFSGF
jgi:hypothetical protein